MNSLALLQKRQSTRKAWDLQGHWPCRLTDCLTRVGWSAHQFIMHTKQQAAAPCLLRPTLGIPPAAKPITTMCAPQATDLRASLKRGPPTGSITTWTPVHKNMHAGQKPSTRLPIAKCQEAQGFP